MRILLITDSLSCGGRERQIVILAKQLIQQRQEVLLVAYDGGYFESYLRRQRIPKRIIRRSFSYDVSILWRTVQVAKSFRPEIIHTAGWMSGVIGYYVSRQYKLPLVENSIQRGKFPTSKKFRQYLVPRLGDVTAANSKAGLGAWGIRRGKVLYNGLEFSRLSNSSPKEGHAGKFVCTMAATFSSKKDYSSFVESARYLVAKEEKLKGGPDFREYLFYCLGDGPQRQEIEHEAGELVTESRLEFPGLVHNVYDYLRISNIGVLMSTEGEGISNSILEYMHAGLPVVCSDCAGNRELVRDGWNGIIVPPFDHEALVDAIEWLATHTKEADRMSKRNQDKANRFSAENMGKKALEIYRHAICRHV